MILSLVGASFLLQMYFCKKVIKPWSFFKLSFFFFVGTGELPRIQKHSKVFYQGDENPGVPISYCNVQLLQFRLW